MTCNYIEEIDHLWQRQLTKWNAVIKNYGYLANVTTRVVELGDSSIVLQYNPERLKSSSADIDDASLKARPCFLCDENQPEEQETVMWEGRYKMQVNPYPCTLPKTFQVMWFSTMVHAAELRPLTICISKPGASMSCPFAMSFSLQTQHYLMPTIKAFLVL